MEKQMVTMEEIKKYVEEHNLSVDILTEEELEQVKEEIIAIKAGYTILDGVLSNPELSFRKMKYGKRES